MGCDIHMVLERRDTRGKWVGLHAFPSYIGWIATGRNYSLFAEIAQVRGEGTSASYPPKGMPVDASDLAIMKAGAWGAAGHSHSWLSVEDFARCIIRINSAEEIGKAIKKKMSGEDPIAHITYSLFHISYDEDIDNYRLVFWFDN